MARRDVQAEEKVLNQLKQCLKDLEVNPLKGLLREAANLGLDNQIISEARHLCYGMSKSELCTKRITLALQQLDANKLCILVEEAKEDGIENEEVERACDFVAVTLELGDWNSKMRMIRARTACAVTEEAVKRYTAWLETRGLFPLREYVYLRTEENYARFIFLHKDMVKKDRLVWQKADIPRSLTRLSTVHCGLSQRAKVIKTTAKKIFVKLKAYMGDSYYPYPVTMAYEILNIGVAEEMLRDEIFVQLIKQTTKNPSLDSRRLGWKLLFLCISTFPPSEELKPFLVSHLAAHSPAVVRVIEKREWGFNAISELAYMCYVALEDVYPRFFRLADQRILQVLNNIKFIPSVLIEIIGKYAQEEILRSPSMVDIEKMTNGTLGAVPSFFAPQ